MHANRDEEATKKLPQDFERARNQTHDNDVVVVLVVDDDVQSFRVCE